MRITAKTLLMIMLAAISGCGKTFNAASHHVARKASTDALLPVKSGMTMENAYKAIAGSGDFTKDQEGHYHLAYVYFIDNYSFLAHHVFGADGRVITSSMQSREALSQASSAKECETYFNAIMKKLEGRFGEVDYAPKTHSEYGHVSATAAYTFSDSSSVKLIYKYPEKAAGSQKCIIIASEELPWIEGVCSATRQRYCRDVEVPPLSRGRFSRFR